MGHLSARNVYACADGRHVTVASNEPRTWATLCEALGAPELSGHRFGLDEDPPVAARLAELFRTKPAADWLATPGLTGGVGPVNDVADLLQDPQVTDRGSLVRLEESDVRVLANPLRFGGADGAATPSAATSPPALGADTDEVLATAGFTAEEIAELRADAVVA